MRRIIRTAALTGAWLLASPSLPLQFGVAPWLEVGPPPAVAATARHAPRQAVRHKAIRRVVRGSSTPPGSNQPGLYPFRPLETVPDTPTAAPTVNMAPPVPGYPNVPSAAIIPRGSTGGAGAETFSDKVVRCNHQAGMGGLNGDAGYIGACINQ